MVYFGKHFCLHEYDIYSKKLLKLFNVSLPWYCLLSFVLARICGKLNMYQRKPTKDIKTARKVSKVYNNKVLIVLMDVLLKNYDIDMNKS